MWFYPIPRSPFSLLFAVPIGNASCTIHTPERYHKTCTLQYRSQSDVHLQWVVQFCTDWLRFILYPQTYRALPMDSGTCAGASTTWPIRMCIAQASCSLAMPYRSALAFNKTSSDVETDWKPYQYGLPSEWLTSNVQANVVLDFCC